MTIPFNYKDSFDTETTAENKSMGFNPSAINLVGAIYWTIVWEGGDQSLPAFGRMISRPTPLHVFLRPSLIITELDRGKSWFVLLFKDV